LKKIAIYCRVSTQDQNTLNQRLVLEKYAQDRAWEYAVFEETESTRKTRPVKQRLLQLLRNGEFEGVLVYKLDRYARSLSELILEVKELIDKGLSFISVTDNLNFDTAAGKLQFGILCCFSEFERDLIRERTIEGLKRAKQQGKQLGRPKGSKDSGKRKTTGYKLRKLKSRIKNDRSEGIYKSMEEYI
jgi:putative DNA-invertase from lambdoid prophage Rac